MSDETTWMCLLDERILERLEEDGDAAPWEIVLDLSMTASTDRVRERCWILANAEFVEPYPHQLAAERYTTRFAISDRGRDYLDGSVEDRLIRPVPAPRPSYATRPDWWAGFG